MLTFVLTTALSLLLQRIGRNAPLSSQSHILTSVGLGWAIIAAIGALPIWLTAITIVNTGEPTVKPVSNPTVTDFTNGLNALFEGVSGFTSAGLTMVSRPSQLPACLQWWRSLMQWVGGIGVIVLAIALLEPSKDSYVLYQAEGRQARIGLTITRTVRRILAIYTGYTLFSLFLLKISGMSWWVALNHAMSAISTGGFSITDNSMGAYSLSIKLVLIVVMFLGAMPFSIHDQILSKKNLAALLKDRQHFLLLSLGMVGCVVVGLEHYRFVGQFAWIESIFQWLSALTTCGFSTQSLQFWSSRNKLLLSIAMVMDGAAGSTAGGLKLRRIVAMFESVSWRLRRTTLSSRQIVLRQVDGQLYTPEQASRKIEEATALGVLWIVCLGIGVLLLTHVVPTEYTLSDVIFETSAALGTAGLSVGITTPSLHWSGKCVLIVLMWMSRLEIVPVLMLLLAPWNYLFKRFR